MLTAQLRLMSVSAHRRTGEQEHTEGRRTCGMENRKIEGQEDMRNGGQKDRRTGGQGGLARTGGRED